MSSLLDAARAAVDAGLSAAREQGLRVAVVVIDHSFTPVCLARIDGAYPSSVAVAQAKASTSINFGVPSATVAAKVSAENKIALAAVDRRLMFVGGGVPIRSADRVVAAVGVSGATEADDVNVAERAAAAAEQVLAETS